VTNFDFELACPACDQKVACVAVAGETVTQHCLFCECSFDITVSQARPAEKEVVNPPPLPELDFNFERVTP
jgi:hypothetical protein